VNAEQAIGTSNLKCLITLKVTGLKTFTPSVADEDKKQNFLSNYIFLIASECIGYSINFLPLVRSTLLNSPFVEPR